MVDPATGEWATIEASPGAAGLLVGATMLDDEIVWWTGATPPWGGCETCAGAWNAEAGTTRVLGAPPMTLRRDGTDWVAAPELGAVITWGGSCGEGCNTNLGDGGVLDVTTGTWGHLGNGGLGARSGSVIVWTGTELLVWGGSRFAGGMDVDSEDRVDGARWRPDA